MKNKTTIILQIILIIAMFGSGLYFWNDLPDLIPTHWNIAGEIDDYSPKVFGVLLIPAITLIMIDPKNKNYKHFQKSWNLMQFYLVLFFTYVYFITIFISLGGTLNVSQFIVGGIGVLFILLGNLFGKIRQNYFIGIKVPWTLNNEENWNKTHRFGGFCFVIVGFIVFIAAILNYINFYIMIGGLITASLLPIFYSYFLFKKQK